MGKEVTRSILGEYSGRIGPVVLTHWKSISVVRSRPKPRIDKSPKPNQVVPRTSFKEVNHFFSRAKPIIELGYQQKRGSSTTKMNDAVSYHLQHAVALNGSEVMINLEALKLSHVIHVTQPAWKASVQIERGAPVKFEWALNPYPQNYTRLDDEAVAIVYVPKFGNKNDFFQHKTAKREDCGLVFPASIFSAGAEVYCYLFMRSADGKLVSDTCFLGNFTV